MAIHRYDIETVKRGDKITLFCAKEGCRHHLTLIVNYPSTMECYCPRYKINFDMRNQEWRCHQHRLNRT